MIVPLEGYIVTKPVDKELRSIFEQEVANKFETKFVVVDSKAGRSDTVGNANFVRKFVVIAVSDSASDTVKSYLNKTVYCVCNENEKDNLIIIDKDTGEKLFILPETAMLATER